MPIYEYACSDCGSEFELIRPLSQADKEAPCPHCHKSARRKLSTFACYTINDSGVPASLGGTGGSCNSCSSSSCSTCGL